MCREPAFCQRREREKPMARMTICCATISTLADYLSSLDADERTKFRAAVNARVTPVAAPQAG